MTTLFAQYRAKNHTALEAIARELEAMDFDVVKQDTVLRCELRFGDELAGYAFFASAEHVFSLDKQPDEDEDEIDRERRERGERSFKHAFWRFQREAMDAVRQTQPYPECSLFVIGDEEVLSCVDPERRTMVESDEMVARKYVQPIDVVKVILTNPFLSKERTACERPTFDTVNELIKLNENAPPVDVVLTYADSHNEPDAQALFSDEAAEVRACIENIVWRVGGTTYKIFWTPEEVSIGRVWDSRGRPLLYAGDGERKLFAFAHFMATEAMKLQPGQRIGLYGALNGFSVLWFVEALEVLRRFSYATGVSVRLQIPQRDRRETAKYRMKKVATVLEVAPYPYD